MTLSTLRNELRKIERAIDAADRARYADMLDVLHAKRHAMNSLATHCLPRSKTDAAFLHELIDEFIEFVADEPASPIELAAALEAIERMNGNLRSYQLGE